MRRLRGTAGWVCCYDAQGAVCVLAAAAVAGFVAAALCEQDGVLLPAVGEGANK